jgi:hypothetical protein
MKRLDDLLKKNILSEAEFAKANASAKDKAAALAARKEELAA